MSKFCTKCGKPVTPTQKFCTLCGNVMAPAASAPHVASAPATQLTPDYAATVIVNDSPQWNPPAPLSPEPTEPTVIEDVQPTVIEEAPVESVFEPAVVSLLMTDAASGSHAYSLEVGQDTEVLVGRDGRAVTVKIDDPRSSRQHFSIKLGNGEFIVTDLESSNGTFVNGLKVVEPARLMDGDTITFGRSEAVFSLISAPSAWSDSSTHS